MKSKVLRIVISLSIFLLLSPAVALGKRGHDLRIPTVVITDLYHPYQDPGDNLDLINGFGLSEIDLLAVIIDATDAFRKDTADHPTLWHDPRGPRELGIIPLEQMRYIFKRDVPYGIGPLSMMSSPTDKMENISSFENGVDLLLNTLRSAKEPVQVLMFGSARVAAVAYNREPELMRKKIAQLHLSMGTGVHNYELGSDQGANVIPGGEWNVALDPFAFTRLLRSDLPMTIYPCACKDGGFALGENNTYWHMQSMSFVNQMDPELQCYLGYAYSKSQDYDFLRKMDSQTPFEQWDLKQEEFFHPGKEFHFWETAIWLGVTGRELVKSANGEYYIKQPSQITDGDVIIPNEHRPCEIEVRDDGRFDFKYTDRSNVRIYYRPDPVENQKALNSAVPKLFLSYRPSGNQVQD